MQITVQFFSQLRELAGASEEVVELPEGSTADDLLQLLYQLHPPLARWDRNILIGAGVAFVERDHPLQPEESIAIMPPVQGG
jgi:molybdopterin converting factor small subunit